VGEGHSFDEDKPLESIFRRAVLKAEENGRLTGNQLLALFGAQALGPVLVLLGLIAVVPPIGAVPGVPTICGVLTFVVSIQFVVGRQRFWVPRFLGEREASAEVLIKTEAKIHKGIAAIDKLVRARRLSLFTGRRGTRATAGVACLLAVVMPPLEIIPFAVAVPGTALIMLGLGLSARDGLFIMIGFTFTAAVLLLVAAVVPGELFPEEILGPNPEEAPIAAPAEAGGP
jgi:hypothetical protein